MDDIIEQLRNVSDLNDIEDITNELTDFKENLIGALDVLDPVNGLDDIMEDIDIILQKINGDIEW